MLLVMDIGNTNMKLGLYEGTALKQHWRLSTDRDKTPDEVGVKICGLFRIAGIDLKQIEGVAISCVVPPVMDTLHIVCERYLKQQPLVVGPGIMTGMPILTENPAQTGADRIAAAVGAIRLYGPPLIVLGLGTATTLTVIDDQGRYIGGMIAPGLQISADALFRRAAKLPHIEIRKPAQAVGTDTVGSMQSGLYHGFVSQIEGMIDRIRAEHSLPFKVAATGGLSALIGESRSIDYLNSDLIFEGLRFLWDMNNGRPKSPRVRNRK